VASVDATAAEPFLCICVSYCDLHHSAMIPLAGSWHPRQPPHEKCVVRSIRVAERAKIPFDSAMRHKNLPTALRSWILSRGLGWPVCFLALAYLMICASYGGVDGAAVVCPDTPVYQWPASHLSPSSVDFYTAYRPFTTLWLFWLVRSNHRLVVVFQIAIAACGWLALAFAMQRLFHRRWVMFVAMLLTLLPSLAWPIQAWNYLLLSESLCFSLLPAVLALSILVFHPGRSSLLYLGPTSARPLGRPRASWAIVVLWGSLFILWGGTRDTVVYSIAVVALGLLCRGLWLLRRTRRMHHHGLATPGPDSTFLVFAGLFLLCLSFGLNELTEKSGRWRVTVLNSIQMRILPDRVARDEWVRKLGMPDSPRLREFTGKYYWDHVGNEPQEIRDTVILNPAVYGDGLKGFPAWLSRHGLQAMRSYLLRHPWDTITSAVVAYAGLPPYRSDSYLNSVHRPAVSRISAWLFFPVLGWQWKLFTLTFLALVAGCCADKKWAPLTWSLVLLVNAFIQIEAGYHGDAHAIDRHTLLAGLLLRLSLIILFCGAIDRRPDPCTAVAPVDLAPPENPP
jgi:hypothetical protein